MNIELIDTHTHLYVDSFDTDIGQVIQRAIENNIRRFYLPAIDSETHEAMIALEKKYEGTCISMMGLHPCSVKENYHEELEVVKNWLDKRSFVAIGEIGLDYYWDTSFKGQQIESFHIQIERALEKNMAEREGFEPPIEFPLYTLSRRAPSTTRTPLLLRAAKILHQNLVSENILSIQSCLTRNLFKAYLLYFSELICHIPQIAAFIPFSPEWDRCQVGSIGLQYHPFQRNMLNRFGKT